MSRARTKTPTEDPRAQIAAVVAHQLRNRLSRVVFGVEALTRAAGARPELVPATARVRRGVDELVVWFDQLVELVRVMSGGSALRAERLDLVMLAGATVERARSLFDARQQILQVELPREPIWVDGDAVALDVAIGNVLNNAAKFTPTSGKIRVQLVAGAEEARLSIRDEGIGISPGRLAQIFDPFAPEERVPGQPSGIRAGLFLARALFAMHHGTVTVRSEGEGRGSEFVLSIPVARGPEIPVENNGAIRALVVHPRRGMAGMISALLRSWGYHVHSAEDADGAIEEARRFAPAVVVMDATLSAESGYMLARRMREVASEHNARYVVVGGAAGKGLTDGVDGEVAGELDPDLLHAALRRR